MKIFLISCLVLGLSLAVSGRGVPGRVVGGSDAEEGQYPYQVSLQKGTFHFCGGSILNNRWILTAAHCVVRQNAQRITVVVGITSLSDEGTRYQADLLVPHKEFDSSLLVNDIALIRVTKDIVFGEKVQPVELSPKNFDENDYPAVLTGWGSTRLGGPAPDNLQQIDLFLISEEKCKSKHYLAIDTTHICTFTKQGEGACHGDSGGPLVADGLQVGIVSWGIPCARGYPDVFTRVYVFHDWVKETMESNQV